MSVSSVSTSAGGGIYAVLPDSVYIGGDTAYLTLTGALSAATNSNDSLVITLYDSSFNSLEYDTKFSSFSSTTSTVYIPLSSTQGTFNGTVYAWGLSTGGTNGDTVSFSFNSLQALPSASQPATQVFGDWESSFNDFSGAATAITWGDGVANLAKYVYDIDPSQPMAGADYAVLPEKGKTSGYLTLTYRQNAELTGVTVNAQTSPDLQTWTTVAIMSSFAVLEPGVNILKTGNDPITGDPIMQVQVPVTGAKQFLRLNVTMP